MSNDYKYLGARHGASPYVERWQDKRTLNPTDHGAKVRADNETRARRVAALLKGMGYKPPPEPVIVHDPRAGKCKTIFSCASRRPKGRRPISKRSLRALLKTFG